MPQEGVRGAVSLNLVREWRGVWFVSGGNAGAQ